MSPKSYPSTNILNPYILQTPETCLHRIALILEIFVVSFGICLFRKVLFNPQSVVYLSTMHMSPPKYFFQLTNKALSVQLAKSLLLHLSHVNL